jgi:hypothetical protein
MTGVLKTPSGMFEEKDDGALLIIAAAIQVYLLRSFQETFWDSQWSRSCDAVACDAVACEALELRTLDTQRLLPISHQVSPGCLGRIRRTGRCLIEKLRRGKIPGSEMLDLELGRGRCCIKKLGAGRFHIEKLGLGDALFGTT